MTLAPVLEWEENTERRLGIVEQKVDKLLDPETGIYPKLTSIEARLAKFAIGILGFLVVDMALLIATLAGHK